MRTPRPHIPLEVRCRVVLRQLGYPSIDEVISIFRYLHSLRDLLNERLGDLAKQLGVTRVDLHLDHDPPLAARERIGDGFKPDANDPEYLFYRTKESHRIKTLQRGDGAQYPDRVLIKRMKRLVEPRKVRPTRKILSRPFPKRPS
jgi:hypothetical protein